MGAALESPSRCCIINLLIRESRIARSCTQVYKPTDMGMKSKLTRLSLEVVNYGNDYNATAAVSIYPEISIWSPVWARRRPRASLMLTNGLTATMV